VIYLAVVLSAIICAILYRAGGMSKDSQEPLSKWIPVWLRQSWVRDWICPMCFGVLFIPHSWFQFGMWLCYYGATGGMLSTYWDWMFKGKDTYWFAGLMVGLAGFFLMPLGTHWWAILARSGLIAICWYALSLQKNADIAEYGRGFILL
jgi:hypothetical protein